MKMIIIVLLISIATFAQKHAFKVNPAIIFDNGYEFSYENFLHNGQSIEFSIRGNTLNKDQTTSISLFGAELKYKFYLQKKPTFTGLYLAPLGNFFTASATNENTKRFLVAGIGGVVGYQFMLGSKNQESGFIFDMNVGLSNYFLNSKSNENLNQISGLQTRLGIGVGYAF